MKIKFLISSIILLFVINIAHANTTEIKLFNCIWTIPENMSITKNKDPFEIVILSENLAPGEYLKTIKVMFNKKDHAEFLNSMNIEKTNVGQYNIYFNVFSLSSETHSVINNLAPVLYENEMNETFAVLIGFTEAERLKLTSKCL